MSEETYVYNNLIYISNQAKITFDIRNESEYNSFKNNLYYGTVAINPSYEFKHDTSEIFNTDPLLSNPGGTNANDYKLKSDSPALKTGILISGSSNPKNFIENNGGKDYFGNNVSNSEKPNIGATMEIRFLFFSFFFHFFLLSCEENDSFYFDSINGNDQNPGSKELPFRSI